MQIFVIPTFYNIQPRTAVKQNLKLKSSTGAVFGLLHPKLWAKQRFSFKLKTHKSHTLLQWIPHTCCLHFKWQFFSSNFTDVLSNVFLLYAVDHQLTNLALWLCMYGLAGSQQLAILVPFHVCLVINYLTAQGGFLGESSFHFPLNRLFVEESGFSLDFCRSNCKGMWWQYYYLYKKDLTPHHRQSFDFTAQKQTDLAGAVHKVISSVTACEIEGDIALCSHKAKANCVTASCHRQAQLVDKKQLI